MKTKASGLSEHTQIYLNSPEIIINCELNIETSLSDFAIPYLIRFKTYVYRKALVAPYISEPAPTLVQR